MNVQHYLGIYIIRKRMQDEGITNPTLEIKTLTKTIVEKLSNMELDEKINIIGKNLLDSKGNIIVTFPD